MSSSKNIWKNAFIYLNSVDPFLDLVSTKTGRTENCQVQISVERHQQEMQ